MAKKKTTIEEIIPDTSQTPEIQGSSLPWVKIKVYKVVPGISQPRYCFTSNVDIDEEMLQNSAYGGGRYDVIYVDANGVETQHVTYEIADKPQPNQPLTADAVQIQMLREQRQQTHELLMAVLGTGGKAATPMNELATMWGIMQGNAPGGGSTNILDIFMKGLEFGRKADGGLDWKGALIDAGKEVLPSIAAAVAAHGKQPIPVQMLPNVGHGAIPGNGNGTIPPGVREEPTPDALIKAGLQYMKPRILAGMPYDLALEWITTNANDPQYSPLVNFAMSKTLDDLIALDSDIAQEPYKTWFSNVMQGIKEHFAELSKNDEQD